MTHRELCVLAARFFRYRKSLIAPTCPYVVIELVTATSETPDVFGWNYWTTVLVEVKVSRADFRADFKKPWRINATDGLGEHRYYCCPKGLIKEEELPEHWGLLYESNGVIEVIKEAERQPQNASAVTAILTSVMRREGLKQQIYDYRKKKITDK